MLWEGGWSNPLPCLIMGLLIINFMTHYVAISGLTGPPCQSGHTQWLLEINIGTNPLQTDRWVTELTGTDKLHFCGPIKSPTSQRTVIKLPDLNEKWGLVRTVAVCSKYDEYSVPGSWVLMIIRFVTEWNRIGCSRCFERVGLFSELFICLV